MTSPTTSPAASPVHATFWSLWNRATQGGLGREVIGTFGAKIVLIVAGLVTSVLTARLLGPEGRGVFAVAVAASALCIQFGNLGLHASNTYTVARDKSSLPALAANSLGVSVVVGAVVLVLMSVEWIFAPSLLNIPRTMQVLVVISVPFGLAYLLLQNLLIGMGRIRDYNVVDVALKVGIVAAIGLLILFRDVTPVSIFVVTVVAAVSGCLAALGLLGLSGVHRLRPSVGLVRGTLRYGLKAYASALFAYVTLRFDLLMVQHYSGSVQAGYYSIAASYGDLVYLLPTVVATVLFPRLSALETHADRWALTRKAVLVLGSLTVAGVAIAALCAPLVVRVLFGYRFMPAIPAILWLMPGLACLSINTVFMVYFASLGMPPIAVVSPAIAGAANIALNTALIPRMGIVGASVSSSIAYAMMLAMSTAYILLRRKQS